VGRGEKMGVRFWLGEVDGRGQTLGPRRGQCGVGARAAGRTACSAARERRGGREKREGAAVGPTCKREGVGELGRVAGWALVGRNGWSARVSFFLFLFIFFCILKYK
jgi:hypothetical protein